MTPDQRAAALRLIDELASVHPLHPYVHMCGSAAALLRELAAEPDWQALRDPHTLHANLLRGQPAQLTREQFLHLAGEPAQEPVAWMQKADGRLSHSLPTNRAEHWHWKPLYAAPPQRQPLTDKQAFASRDIMDINGRLLGMPMVKLMEVVRAVERAHGIGEKP